MPTLIRSKPHSKSSQISPSLRRMAEEAGPDGKLPTYAELLSMLQVSRTTLNAALDDLEGQRVIYRRHGIGIFAASEKQERALALVCDPLYFKGSTHSPFWDVLLREVRERAEADDLSCEIHFSKSQDVDVLPFSENLMSTLSQGHVQGVLGVGMNRAAANWLHEKRINYVSFGGPGSYYVGIDAASLIRRGVQELAELGCGRIALLSSVAPYKQYAADEDLWSIPIEVFRMALAQHDLPLDMSLVKVNEHLIREAGGMTMLTQQEQGHQATHRLFEEVTKKGVDGLLVTDDLMAVGVLAALKELQIQPGRDLQIVTHANRGTTVLSSYDDCLTRLEIDPSQIVDVMFSTVLDLVRGKKPVGYMHDPIHGTKRQLIQPSLRRPGDILPEYSR